MFSDIEDCSYMVVLVKDESVTEYIDSNLVYKHAELYKYSLYKLVDNYSNSNVKYCILQQDYRNYWNIGCKCIIEEAYNYNNDTLHNYVELTDKLFENLKKIIPKKTQIDIYFMQRLFWNDNIEIRNRPAKKIEFEAAYKLFLGLSARMVITHQVNFMNYYVDMLFELNSTLDYKIPRIGVEIDENDHCDRNPEEEETRQHVIEHFDNIIYRIPIMKTDSDEIIDEKVNETIELINKRVDDLLIIYNPDLSKDQLENELLKYNFSEHIIQKFLDKHDTGDEVFCLRHDIIAKYLDYGESDNYKHFKKLFTSKNIANFKENIDYKIIKKDANDGQVSFASNIDSIGRKNSGGKTKETIIIFPRSTFHNICMLSKKPKAFEIARSFSKMYEIIMKYVIASRNHIVKHNRSNVVLETDIKNRIEVLVEQRYNKSNYKKLENEINKYKTEINNSNNRIIELESNINELTEQKKILERQCDDQFMNYKEEEYKYNELKEEYSQLNDNYKVLQQKYVKTTDIIQEYHNPQDNMDEQYNIIRNCNITKLKKIAKSITIKGYTKYNKNTKDTLINMIIDKCKSNNIEINF
jgi:hypothetical protein